MQILSIIVKISNKFVLYKPFLELKHISECECRPSNTLHYL